MDWIQFLQIVCVPAFGWFFYKLGEQRREIKTIERDLNGLLSGLGVAISPELVEHIVALAVSAFGIVEIVRSEKTGK